VQSFPAAADAEAIIIAAIVASEDE
jgi:hypothetical protein